MNGGGICEVNELQSAGCDTFVSARNEVDEGLPHVATRSIIAERNVSCKQTSQFLQLLEYSWRSTWSKGHAHTRAAGGGGGARHQNQDCG